jgi:enamine deaminase RidA (YjgF/YER057c/UK114 family)
MANNLFIAHNPDSVWQVPDTLRSIYSHAAEVAKPGRILFISGQFGVAPDGHLGADFAAQRQQAMDNVEALLATAGMNITNLAS